MQCSTSAANSRGSPSRFGNGTDGAERILRLLRQRAQHRRAENAGRDRQHANAELREFARRRQRQRGNAALRRRIGGLADLALEGGDRRGGDDDAALAVRQRLELACMAAATSRIMLKVPIRLMRMTRS